MADYMQAVKKGLEAAEATDRAKKEIDSVFEDLDRQVREVTEGKVGIKRKELTPPGWEGNTMVPEIVKYWAILAYNPKVIQSPGKELAKWRQNRAGYPCKISWGNIEQTCEDKMALEGTLTALLGDPIVGETLLVLMQLEEKE